MKSIKPGRGPSGLGFIGSIAAIIFGIFWTILAAGITSGFGMGSPFGFVGLIFPMFGVIFIILGIVQAVYNFKNATGKDRYSIIDITDSSEEGDPSSKWVKDKDSDNEENRDVVLQDETEKKFCPYCGTMLEKDFVYCPKCGKTSEVK